VGVVDVLGLDVHVGAGRLRDARVVRRHEHPVAHLLDQPGCVTIPPDDKARTWVLEPLAVLLTEDGPTTPTDHGGGDG